MEESGLGEVIVRQMVEMDIKSLVKDIEQSDVLRVKEYFHFWLNAVNAGKRVLFVALLDDKFVGAKSDGKGSDTLRRTVKKIYKNPNVDGINDLEIIILEAYRLAEETYPEINLKELKA